MTGVDAGINDVGASALATGGVISVRRLPRSLGGETRETPWRSSLGGVRIDGNHGILLNIGDLRRRLTLVWLPIYAG